ncbi:MAG: hypothetical protein Q7J34_03985 [Bacteroidales bacterium]|jgi:hypothetical protein|nr:hypothetical protein [Bacteroidales bacterium]
MVRQFKYPYVYILLSVLFFYVLLILVNSATHGVYSIINWRPFPCLVVYGLPALVSSYFLFKWFEKRMSQKESLLWTIFGVIPATFIAVLFFLLILQ